MKQLMITLIICLSFSVNADPAPFGLEIGKATVSDLKKKYKTNFIDKNLYSKGDMYSIDVNDLNIEGLQKVTAIFSANEKLIAIFTIFPKHKFNYLYGTLNKKYKQKSKNIPFVGNKSAEFQDGESTIYLESIHLGFDTNLNYVDSDFLNFYLSKLEENKQKKKKRKKVKNLSYNYRSYIFLTI